MYTTCLCFDNVAVAQILILRGALLQILGMQKQASGCIAGRNSLVMLEVEQNQDTLKKYVNSPVVFGRRKRTKTTCMYCLFYMTRMRGVSVNAAERLAPSFEKIPVCEAAVLGHSTGPLIFPKISILTMETS